MSVMAVRTVCLISCTFASIVMANATLEPDCARPIEGKMVLVLVGSHSKWIEAMCTPNIMSAAVIEKLGKQFYLF